MWILVLLTLYQGETAQTIVVDHYNQQELCQHAADNIQSGFKDTRDQNWVPVTIVAKCVRNY